MKLYYRIISFLKHLKSKIAFYPALFALTGLLLAFLMMYLEERGISQYLMKNFPIVMVESGDTALTILSALITGLISMMVFSFSMVMLLLSQASNNYSPRLLPGLISDKVHQIILGIYIATILYLIFILFSISPTEDTYSLPGFAVLVGIILTVICIYSFIYFIHNISQSIQINNILDEIYDLAKKRLKLLIEDQKNSAVDFPEEDGWFEYYTHQSGYLQNFSIPNLITACQKYDTRISILPIKGVFVLEGAPLFKSEKELDQEALKDVLSNFIFARGELVGDNYLLGFKQITEVIVKAMSPGINDPGTALNGIDYLTELFFLRLQKDDTNYVYKDNKAYVKMNSVSFEELMYNVMASIRTYCKHDVILVQKLIVMFRYMKSESGENHHYTHLIDKEAQNLIDDVKSSISNDRDVKIILKMAQNSGLMVK